MARETDRGARDPVAHRQDETGFLGDRDEFGRRYMAAIRVLPAYQRLGLAHAAGRDLDDGLIEQMKLTGGQRGVHVRHEAQAAFRTGLHRRREVAHPVAPGALGVVHRLVGLLQQILVALCTVRIQRDADRRRYIDQLVEQLEGLMQRAQYLAGDLFDHVGVFQPAQHHGEFVATETGDRVGVAHAAGDALRRLLQQAVASRMAERVVHFLEAVEVDEQHRQLAAAALAQAHLLAQVMQQQMTVRQIGQRVVVGLPPDGLFVDLLVADVAHDAEHGRFVAIGEARGDQLYPQRTVAVAVQQLHLVTTLRFRPGTDASRIALAPQFEEVRMQHVGESEAGEFLDRVAEHAWQGRIDEHEAVVLRDEHAVRHRVEQCPLGGFGAFEFGLHAAPFGDVGMGADHAQRPAFGVAAHHLAAIEYPLVLAVAAEHAVLVAVARRAAVEVGLNVSHHPRQIVRVHPFRPLRQRVADVELPVAQHRLPARAEEDGAVLDVPVPYAVAGAFEGELPAQLAGDEVALGALLLAEVAPGGDEHLAAVAAEGGQQNLDHHLAAIGAADGPFEAVIAVAPGDVHHFQRLRLRRTAVRLAQRRNVGRTQPDHRFARGEVQHAHRRRVAVGEHA